MRQKNWIKVGLSNLSVLRSAGQDGVSWVEEDGRWKIAYENTLSGLKLRLPESFKSAVRTKGAGS